MRASFLSEWSVRGNLTASVGKANSPPTSEPGDTVVE
jgi:hypothetical protein